MYGPGRIGSMTPQDYCRQKVAPRGSSLYYALYFAERDQQAALWALHAYQAEVTEIVRECRDRTVALAKLNWWRQELDRTFGGQAQHPVAQALQQDVLARYSLAREYFEEVLDGVHMDLEYGLYPSFKELSLYCHRVGGSITQLAVEIAGHQDRQTTRYAHDLGMGLQLFSLLRRVRRNLAAGRLYLPEDELSRFGVSQADLLQPQTGEQVRALFAYQADRIDSFLTQALDKLPAVDAYRQRSGVILARLQAHLLAEMRAEGFPLLEREFHLTPIRKLWIAWRETRALRRQSRKTP